MDLERRIERIERRLNSRAPGQCDILDVVNRLIETPAGELVPGEPELDPDTLRIYYAFVLANLSFARERPEFYTQADLEDWQTRELHAESLVEALERQDPTCDVRAAAECSKRTWLAGLRQYYTGEAQDCIPM